MNKKLTVPVRVSARHIHLSKKDLSQLFGEEKLNSIKHLDQPTQFACQQTLTIKNGDKKIEKVRVVGPTRKKTQVEISQTDNYQLGIDSPIKESVLVPGPQPAKIEIIGPQGSVKRKAAIIPHRHLHLNPQQAQELNLKSGDKIQLKIEGKRGLIFKNVLVRVKKRYDKSVHIDTDEGNAAGIDRETVGEIIINN